jgi:PAS domain S-box-containing protein
VRDEDKTKDELLAELVNLRHSSSELQAAVLLAKEAEHRLQESEERYRTLVENLNDVVYRVDMEGRISYVSPAVERLTCYKTCELLGQLIERFVHQDDRPSLMERHQRILEGETKPHEYRLIDKDGREIHIRTYSRPLYEAGKLVGLSGLFSDITERKQAEEQLREAEYRYRRLFEKCACNVCHHAE